MLWFTLLSILGISAALTSREDHVFAGEDEADLYLLLPRIYNLLPQIYERVESIVYRDGIEEIVSIFMDTNNTIPSSDCLACRAFLTVLDDVINSGSFEEIEEAFMDVCYIVVNASDDLGIPEYICPGISENYLHHAVYVLNTTTMDHIDICLLWNECLYNDFDPPYPENDTLVCKPPPIPASAKRKPARSRGSPPRDLENAIKVVHMTDIHVDGWYDVGSPTLCGMPTCCRYTWPGEGEAGFWGDYLCNQPLRISDLMMSYLATLAPQYIMYTGDNPPHTPWEDTYDSQYNMSALLVDAFTRNIPGVRVLPSLGNHDIAPVNLYFNERPVVQDGNRDLSILWQGLAGFGPEEMATFQYAAYYTTLLEPGLRVLNYNSNYGWLENFYSILRDRHPDYVDMKAWMEQTLEEARQNGEKVILLAHHPTGQSQGNNEYSCFVTDLHARYSDVIVLHLSGHKHGDLFRLVRDIESGDTLGVQISSPAAGTRTNRNPSFRIFYLDPVTYDILDSDIYRVNISRHSGDLDGSPVPTVDFGYRFTDEYNVTDMSPASMEDLVLRFIADPQLFQRYLYNYETANPDDNDLDCDEDCLEHETCEMMNTAYPGYLVCVGRI